MSAIFNQTFTNDKPIYYPSTWGTGKTAYELYDQWKLTTQYYILSNIIQVVIAALWLSLIFVVLNAIKQMYRLYNLPDTNREKIENRRYTNSNFILSTSFIASILLIITIGLVVIDTFNGFAFLKGGIFLIIFWISAKIYRKLKVYRSQNQTKNTYSKLKKEED